MSEVKSDLTVGHFSPPLFSNNKYNEILLNSIMISLSLWQPDSLPNLLLAKFHYTTEEIHWLYELGS